MTTSTRHARVATDLGELTYVAEFDPVNGPADRGAAAASRTGDALTGIFFPGHWTLPDPATFGEPVDAATDPLFAQVTSQLTEYLAGARREFDLPVRTRGDAFSERVWAMLREIPYGATTTYGALAERLGNPRLAQRVGQAVGRNPLSIVVPCHRVVGADGSLTGYAGGLDRKRRLLALEEPAETREARLF